MLNRREFLKTGVAVGAGLATLPKLHAESRPANDRLNIALIGCGSRAGGLIRGVPQDVNLVAMVDPVKEKRDHFAQQYNAARNDTHCKAYRDFREIIGSEQVDGIIVATPDHWHVPISLVAARHGKDMYVEKPLGVSLKDQFLLRERLKGKNIVFQYGTQQRSSLFARTAVDLVQNGYIGEVEEVDVWSPHLAENVEPGPFDGQEKPIPDGLDYDLYVGPSELLPYHPSRVTKSASWHSYNYAIGFIAGWGAHPLDICQWGLGTDDSGPVHYEGSGVLPDPKSLYNTTRRWDLHCRYGNGIRMRFMDSQTARPVVRGYSRYWQANGTVFKGSDGWVQYSRGAVYLFRNGDYVRATDVAFGDDDKRAYVSNHHMGNFIDSMRRRKATINPFESALRSDTISHLSDIVARTGTPLQWDPEKEQIVDGRPEQIALLDRPRRAPYTDF